MKKSVKLLNSLTNLPLRTPCHFRKFASCFLQWIDSCCREGWTNSDL